MSRTTEITNKEIKLSTEIKLSQREINDMALSFAGVNAAHSCYDYTDLENVNLNKVLIRVKYNFHLLNEVVAKGHLDKDPCMMNYFWVYESPLSAAARKFQPEDFMSLINYWLTPATINTSILRTESSGWNTLAKIAYYQDSTAFLAVINKTSDDAFNQALLAETKSFITERHYSTRSVTTPFHLILQKQNKEAILATIKKATRNTLIKLVDKFYQTGAFEYGGGFDYYRTSGSYALEHLDNESLQLLLSKISPFAISRFVDNPKDYRRRSYNKKLSAQEIESLNKTLIETCDLIKNPFKIYCSKPNRFIEFVNKHIPIRPKEICDHNEWLELLTNVLRDLDALKEIQNSENNKNKNELLAILGRISYACYTFVKPQNADHLLLAYKSWTTITNPNDIDHRDCELIGLNLTSFPTSDIASKMGHINPAKLKILALGFLHRAAVSGSEQATILLSNQICDSDSKADILESKGIDFSKDQKANKRIYTVIKRLEEVDYQSNQQNLRKVFLDQYRNQLNEYKEYLALRKNETNRFYSFFNQYTPQDYQLRERIYRQLDIDFITRDIDIAQNLRIIGEALKNPNIIKGRQKCAVILRKMEQTLIKIGSFAATKALTI